MTRTAAARAKRTGCSRNARDAHAPAANANPAEGTTAYRLERIGRNSVSMYVPGTHRAAKINVRRSLSENHGRGVCAINSITMLTAAASVPARSAYSATFLASNEALTEKR